MADDKGEGVLTPSQRKAMRDVVGKCGACRANLDYLASLGHDDPDLRQRADHLQQLAEKALEIDRVERAGG